jgi:hypothetical protein
LTASPIHRSSKRLGGNGFPMLARPGQHIPGGHAQRLSSQGPADRSGHVDLS